MSSLEIEDVLASIRRLVSDDLRPANKPGLAGKLVLTPAFRVVAQTGLAEGAQGLQDQGGPSGAEDASGGTGSAAVATDWIADHSSLSAVADHEADHLDFASDALVAMQDHGRFAFSRSAMESAAEAFHGQADEFILSLTDSGALILRSESDAVSADSPHPEIHGHGAVFAVLTRAETVMRIAAVAELADAEGGAPVEEEAQWSVVNWDDPVAGRTVDAPPADAVLSGHDAPAMTADNDMDMGIAAAVPEAEGDRLAPLVLPFVSMRRVAPGTGPQEDPSALVDGVVDMLLPAAEEPPTPVAPLILRAEPVAALTPRFGTIRTTPKPEPATPDKGGFDGTAQVDAAVPEADLPGVAATQADAAPVAPDADQPAMIMAGTAVAEISNPDTPAADAPDSTGAVTDVAAPALATFADGEAETDAVGTAPVAPMVAEDTHVDADQHGDAIAVDAPAPEPQVKVLAVQSGADDATLPRGETTADAQDPAHLTDNVFDTAALADAPVADAQDPASRPKTTARLSEAAFTRWPGWAHSAPDGDAAAPEPVAPMSAPVAVAASKRQKPAKPAKPDLGWADRAEAEIHRQLAAELGEVAVREVASQTPSLQLSEAALRDLVRDTIRDELSGKLGERITQNVRKLVQMELQKTLSVQVTEFRSQRREPGSDT